MNKLFTLLVLSLFIFGCSDNDEEKAIDSPLIAIWENLDFDAKFSGWGIGERYIKFETMQDNSLKNEYNFVISFRNSETEKWSFLGCRIEETPKMIYLFENNNIVYSYNFVGGNLIISRPETEETYTYRKVSN
jgi:hypothetical protein